MLSAHVLKIIVQAAVFVVIICVAKVIVDFLKDKYFPSHWS